VAGDLIAASHHPSSTSLRENPIMRLTSVAKLLRFTAALLLLSAPAGAQEIHVMVSGGFSTAYKTLVPEFEKASGAHVETVWGPSMGNTPEAIPARLLRGEPADVVIMARPALDALADKGEVVKGSQVDLVRSRIGMAVRAGTPAPDIHSVAAFRRVLVKARSIAYSDSASGVYIGNELFKRLGLTKQLAGRSRQIPGEPVGLVVARGDAEIGFQQMSELLPIAGITVVGAIPDELQQITAFSAGIVATGHAQEGGRALIRYLASPSACGAIERTALDPVACAPDKTRTTKGLTSKR
jgi:molybdate transport system substrate-binding protein